MRGASISMATVTPIFTDSHSMKLAALVPSDRLESRLVMPRAIKAPGTTAVGSVVGDAVGGLTDRSSAEEIDRQTRHVDAQREHAARERLADQFLGWPIQARGRDVERLQVGTTEARHRRAAHRQFHFAQ